MGARHWKEQVSPELRGVLRRLPDFTFGPITARLFHALTALMPAPTLPEGIALREVRVGDQRLRLFEPTHGPSTPAAVLWIHGGGRIMGSPNLMDAACARVAQQLGVVTASCGYRLAPRHPYPAALDDCVVAWHWLVEHADELRVDPARMAVAGESAGGGLAAELTQRLLDEGGVQPCAQVLVYPMLDDRVAARRELDDPAHLVWNNRSNQYGWRSYLGTAPGADQVGEYAAAARREDLTGLPPAWLTVGELDLFHDENLDYVERLRAAGVPVELELIAGGFHGYFAMAGQEPPMVRMWESLEGFLRRQLGADPPTVAP